MLLTYQQARAKVIEEARARARPEVQWVALAEAGGRVLAGDVPADRDQPPFHRATRDGFAVRAADVAAPPVRLSLVGEAVAGGGFDGEVGAGECIYITTGAPLPRGADAVIMVEYAERNGDGVRFTIPAVVGDNFVPAGSELRRGAVAVPKGTRVDAAVTSMLASVGCAEAPVARRPSVAVLGTGDEIVPVEATPGPAQIRDSNSYGLAAQVRAAGGIPLRYPAAPDEPEALHAALESALSDADVLIVSGGVSMGEYDLVEAVLAELGGRVFWDGVSIRPGKPAVFAEAAGKLVFALPGNPVSAAVTFELFARPGIEILGGAREAPLRLAEATMAEPFEIAPIPLTYFHPAVWVDAPTPQIALLASQGSGDLAAFVRSEVFAVLPPQTGKLVAGERVAIMAKP